MRKKFHKNANTAETATHLKYEVSSVGREAKDNCSGSCRLILVQSVSMVENIVFIKVVYFDTISAQINLVHWNNRKYSLHVRIISKDISRSLFHNQRV